MQKKSLIPIIVAIFLMVILQGVLATTIIPEISTEYSCTGIYSGECSYGADNNLSTIVDGDQGDGETDILFQYNFTISELETDNVSYNIILIPSTLGDSGCGGVLYGCVNEEGIKIPLGLYGTDVEFDCVVEPTASYNFTGTINSSCILESDKVSFYLMQVIKGYHTLSPAVVDFEFFYGEPPVIEEQSSLEQNVIYLTMRGASAGLGVFIETISTPLFVLLILIVFVAIIAVIAFSMKKVLIEGATP